MSLFPEIIAKQKIV